MQNCASHMDLISEHFYRREQKDLVAHIRQMTESVKQKADAHRTIVAGSIRFAARTSTSRSMSGTTGTARMSMVSWDALLPQGRLGIAAGLHEFTRQSDIMFMANYAQTVNVIGCIKTTKTDACLDTTGLALKLYREHYGAIPLAASASSRSTWRRR